MMPETDPFAGPTALVPVPSGERCADCDEWAEMLVYDDASGVCGWTCAGHIGGREVCTYDPGTVEAIDGVRPS